MRVWFLSPEVSPFSAVGGLAEVIGSLPTALADQGVEVVTLTPLYEQLDLSSHRLQGPLPYLNPVLPGPLGETSWEVYSLELGRQQIWFLHAEELFDGPDIYGEVATDPARFAAFTYASISLARIVADPPDLIHSHDWTAGLGPWWASQLPRSIPSVYTIHNIGYQGICLPDQLGFLAPELPEVLGPPSGHHNLSGLGIRYAGEVTTVSPTHAQEIKTSLGGHGLDELLRSRGDALSGILNGLDSQEWNPAKDHHLPFPYSFETIEQKELNKQSLLVELELSYRPQIPVVGMVSRMVEQKGIQLLPPVLHHFLSTWEMRLVILGSGEPKLEELLRQLVSTYPQKARYIPSYNLGLSHRIEAGVDIFLMPSLYEPCGLNQMYSQLYGTASVVRKVGGLADTVTHFDPDTGEGTGFVFEHYSSEGLGWALGQALDTHTKPNRWRQLQRNMMEQNYRWSEAARRYKQVYQRLVTSDVGTD